MTWLFADDAFQFEARWKLVLNMLIGVTIVRYSQTLSWGTESSCPKPGGVVSRVALFSFRPSVSFLLTPMTEKRWSPHYTPGQAHKGGTIVFSATGVS